MKRMNAWGAVGLVVAMGMAVPGCFLFGDDEYEGRICASPVEGGEYCAPAYFTVASIWKEAANHGSEPIQMWAERPDSMSLDELVKSRSNLNAWFDE
jgi:hypothetical protein